MKKGRWTAVLAAVMMAGLTGCGGGSAQSGVPADSAPASGASPAAGKTKISAYLGGGDTIDQTTAIVKKFNEATPEAQVELVPLPNGSTGYQMLTVMYNAGNPPAAFYLEPGDVRKLSDKLSDVSDLECVQYAAEGTLDDVTIEGKLLGVPSNVQGYGLIYSKQGVSDTLGPDFDVNTIKTRADLEKAFETIEAQGVAPVAISPFDWSLANHYLNQVYSGQAADAQGRDAFMDSLQKGEVSLADNAVFNDYMDTFDLMMKYNYYKENPLETVADNVDKQAQLITTGQCVFWFQGNWASPNIRVMDEEGEYGFIPVPLGGENLNSGKVCTLVPGYYCVEESKSDEAQRAVARKLIDYIVMSDDGKDYTVNQCGYIPAYSNNTLEIKESLSASISAFQQQDKVFPMYSKYPSDHFDVLGQPMQKYLSGQLDRAALAGQIEDYWKQQR